MACQFYFLNLKKYDGCILITENKELNLSHIYMPGPSKYLQCSHLAQFKK